MTPASTSAPAWRVATLRRAATLLDGAFAIPGTSFRIGLDPILGLIPGIGDLCTPVLTVAILLQAWQLRLPRVVLLRIVLNAAIDAGVGAIPVLGDGFDAVWKANLRNLDLLERHVSGARRATAGDWAFVVVLLGLVLVLALLPFVVLAWLISWLLTR